MKTYTPKGYTGVLVAEIPFSEVELIAVDACKQPKATIDSYYSECNVKPDILVNGALFDMSTGNTVGTVVINKVTYSSSAKQRVGLGFNANNTLMYCNWDKASPKPLSFIAGYPPLVENGKACKISIATELNYKCRRTCLGYNNENIYVVCVESPGLAFTALQTLLIKLGCKYAINLDGGGSTRMLVYGNRKTKNVANRAVDTVIKIKLKPYSGKTTYRYGKGLNIRFGPGTKYKVIGNYVLNTNVTIYERQGVWGRTSLGWVNANYVK